MDYEKAYKDALERAKKVHKYSSDLAEIKRMEEIFPELKESEDERIRGAIMHFISHTPTVPKGIINKEQMLAWLEKQGEQPQGKTALEAIKEEKVDNQNRLNPTDEVESKFKVGDWIIDNCGYVWKIEGILNQFYILESVEGGESRPTIEWVNKTFHLWTIQDAKDGDVLASDNSIFIFQEEYIAEKPIAYCGLMNGCFIVDGEDACWTNERYYPATKEQCNILFTKMKGAGYEWDAEKKELKKIHVIDEGKAEMDYCFTKMMNGEKVSSAWSKEDEQIILSIEQVMACASLLNIVPDKIDKIRTWLKSLKQRIGG